MRPNCHITPDDATSTDSDVFAHARTLKDNRSGFHDSCACHVGEGVDEESFGGSCNRFLHVLCGKIVSCGAS